VKEMQGNIEVRDTQFNQHSQTTSQGEHNAHSTQNQETHIKESNIVIFIFHTDLSGDLHLRLDVQRMRAARVGPAERESDFGCSTLLQQKFAFGVEQENAEGAVQQTGLNVRHLMHWKIK
jgi:hypothetical protein